MTVQLIDPKNATGATLQPKYVLKKYTIPPGQTITDYVAGWEMALRTLSPLYDLPNVYISFDDGDFIPVTNLPIRGPWQRYAIQNRSNDQIYLELIIVLDKEVSLEGLGTLTSFQIYYNPITYSFSVSYTWGSVVGLSQVNQTYGPLYVGSRSTLIVKFTDIKVSCPGCPTPYAVVFVFDSTQSTYMAAMVVDYARQLDGGGTTYVVSPLTDTQIYFMVALRGTSNASISFNAYVVAV